jgi:Family of unknown function (DUF6165)
MPTHNQIIVPVSPGELIDKITILRIKSARMIKPEQLANVRLELAALENTWRACAYGSIDIRAEQAALQAVNEKLWVIEDAIRDKERAKAFDQQFVDLARAVYLQNDERATIKRRINEKLGSTIVEEKSYSDYKT